MHREMYRENRQRFLELLRSRAAAAVVFTGEAPLRNGDTEYDFRPASDFVYLTGFREPEAILVLLPNDASHESILYLRDKDRDQEIWTGRRLGVTAAPEALGLAAARPIEDFWDDLPGLLEGHDEFVFAAPRDEPRDRELQETLELLRSMKKRGGRVPIVALPPDETLHELRLIKSAPELECMRKAAAIAVEAHGLAMAEATPGGYEYQVDALIDYTFGRHGCTGRAYPNIVAGGANACILHYVANDALLADGDLLLVDAGAEWEYYASDVTRTYPVNGRFTKEQRSLYDLVLAAQRAAIACVEPGGNLDAVHAAALTVLVDGLLELGLLQGTSKEVRKEGRYRRFFMHKTSHWLGLDVHDCGAYFQDGKSRPFEPGMVTTVEPGLYIAEDDESVEACWRGIGIRIEDDILVTKEGHEVLTAGVPTDPDEVEALCRGEHVSQAASLAGVRS